MKNNSLDERMKYNEVQVNRKIYLLYISMRSLATLYFLSTKYNYTREYRHRGHSHRKLFRSLLHRLSYTCSSNQDWRRWEVLHYHPKRTNQYLIIELNYCINYTLITKY